MAKIKQHYVAAALAMATAAAPGTAIAGSAAYEDRIGAAKSSMMGNSAAALSYARDARALVDHADADAAKDALTASWLEAEALLRLNRTDEATEIAKASLAQAEDLLPGTRLHADILRSNGSVAATLGDYAAALDYFQKSLGLFKDLNIKRSEAIVLQNIGSIYSDAGNFGCVLHYYDQAAQVYPDDIALSLSGHNNRGNAYKELGRHAEAEQSFRDALAIAEKIDSPMLKARILTNLASVLHLSGDNGQAADTAAEALDIAKQHAPDWTPFIYGVQAQIELAQGNVENAEQRITLAFADQVPESTNPLFRDFHKTAAEIFRKRAQPELAERHAAALVRIERSAAAVGL